MNETTSKIIDAHTHFSNISAFFGAADVSKVEYSYEGYCKEQEDNGIVASVCMGLTETAPFAFPDQDTPNPMTADLDERCPPGLHTCLGINPHWLDDAAIAAILRMIKKKNVVGFKIFAGYYHLYIHDPIYTPIYKIAANHGLTVAIHTGDTYSEEGLLDYSHPLAADRLAVQFRDVRFLLCHMGDPWVMDACEVAYKNRNVYLDISGLQAGDSDFLAEVEMRRLVMDHYRTGLVYLNNYKKVLFGTDWPLVPMGSYINFCKRIVPEDTYSDVFYNNAAELYGIS